MRDNKDNEVPEVSDRRQCRKVSKKPLKKWKTNEKKGFTLDCSSIAPPVTKLKKCHKCRMLILAKSKVCDACGAKQKSEKK